MCWKCANIPYNVTHSLHIVCTILNVSGVYKLKLKIKSCLTLGRNELPLHRHPLVKYSNIRVDQTKMLFTDE